MASGWNLWVWLECIGVVSGCCCKEVYRYPHNNYYFSLYTPLALAFLKMFFDSCLLFLCNIPVVNVAQRIFEMLKNRIPANIINYIDN